MKPAVRPWSGDAYRVLILEAAGFDAKHLRKALQRNEEALDAVLPEKRVHKRDAKGHEYVELTEGGAPDWDARATAYKAIYGIVGLQAPPKADPTADPTRPVAVHLHLHSNGAHAGPAFPASGVRLHLSGGEGNDA